MAKEAFYFSHDFGARNDPKLQKVRIKLGHEGKGIFWDLIEMLYEEGGKLLLNDMDIYADTLRTNPIIINSLIHDFGLFQNNNIEFWSNSVNKRLDQRIEKSEKARESARLRWDKNTNALKKDANAYNKDANGLRNRSERNAIKENKGNKNKGKESKEKEIDFKLPVLIATGDEKELFNPSRDLFLDFYKEKYKTGYSFTSMDGEKLYSILKKIVKKTKEKFSGQKESFLLEEIIPGFEWFFTQAYEIGGNWIQSNYSLKNLDTQFNELYSTIKNGKQASKNKSGNTAASPEGVVRAIDKMFNTAS